jgi:hypothetical protein
MIIAMENFIPDRRVLSSEKKSAPAANHRESTAPNSVIPSRPAPPAGPSQSTLANRFTPSEPAPSPYVPLFGSVPDLRVDFPVKNPFVHAR